MFLHWIASCFAVRNDGMQAKGGELPPLWG